MKKKLLGLWAFMLLFSTVNFPVSNFTYAQSEGCEEGGYCTVSFINDYGVTVGTANVMYGSVVNLDDVQLTGHVETITRGYIYQPIVSGFVFGETQIFWNVQVKEVSDVCKEGYYHKNGLCMEYQYNGEIIHDIDEGTITLTYSGESIKILDRNLGAETYGYGLNAPENSYGEDFEFGGTFQQIDTRTIYEGWDNNPCEQIGGYIPKYKDWIKLLKLRGQIRLGSEIAYLEYGAIQDYFSQIMTDLLFPIFVFDYYNFPYLRIDNLWSNEPAGDEHSWIVVIEASTLDGFIDLISNTSGKNKLRCFLPKDEEYSVKFESMEKTVSEQKIPVREYNNADGGYKVTKLKARKIEDPVETGYEFLGWYVENENSGDVEYDFDNIVSSDLSLEAKWEKLKSSNQGDGKVFGSSGGGGKTSVLKTSDVVDKKDNVDSNKDKADANSTNDKSDTNSTNDKSDTNSEEKVKKNQEDIVSSNQQEMGKKSGNTSSKKVTYNFDSSLSEKDQAYNFARSYEITTKDSVQKAQMNENLTRIQMAKMLSNYAINVLGKQPDISKGTKKFNDVTNKMDEDYDNAVTLSYQLGIMGQNMSGNSFRPNDEVSRAEFITALSRLLYSTADGEYESTSKYYTHHMEKLKGKGIFTKDDPNMKELRGYVMIMLMRSAE